MLRGVVRGVARVCRDSEVASLVRGLMEPLALLMLLRSVGESCSCCSTGADTLLPMVRCLHGFVACGCVTSEVKARCGW
jgi:hypothetical protein